MKATATYIFCFSMLLTSCNAINFGSGDLETNLNLEEKEITNVQDIDATFSVRNGTDKVKKYSFSSGCQVSFLLSKDGVEKLRSEDNLGCIAIVTGIELIPNESETFKLPTLFDVELEAGEYMIKAYLIGYEDEVFATKKFSVN
ncbi:MAG TPA: hypothetical protein DF712_06565 [Balneola sp.]|nr:hypothetical protein [Bacteroidota bacterium]HCI69899.1 hypothetical protein [Balneola sp.]HCT52108.1 hypothetical protein [Balneola sp.]|tara:strand:- start:201 stop:632 length:432 start_codon:yes stop_codon:yes gene_type:complete